MRVVSEYRPSPIAGLWYQSDPQQLTLEIEDYLSAAQPPEINGKIIGLVVPHAGHRYSGQTAAYAYKTVLDQSFDTVVILSPMHKYYQQPVITSAHPFYETPLGPVPVDRELLTQISAKMVEKDLIPLSAVANDDEHSVEIQLPFLQRALEGPFSLVPIMLRRKDATLTQALGSCLAELLHNRRALLIASTDLSHFYTLGQALELDQNMLAQIKAFSPEGVLRAEETETGFACGVGAVAAMLAAARIMGATDVEILNYSTSADQTGDPASVVGYGAAAVYQRS
jgi:AmmeMemoRadiSam system protein B